MKKNCVSSLAVLFAVVLFLNACSEDPPSVRVRNDNSAKVNMQLKPAAGSSVNINDVAANTTSVFIDVAEGQWTATASIQGSSIPPPVSFIALNDYSYTLIVTNTNPPKIETMIEAK